MESFKDSMEDVMKLVRKKHGTINVDPDKVLADRDERERQRSIEFTQKLISQERRKMFNSSLISDWDDLKQTFSNFTVNDQYQDIELRKAKNIADRITSGEQGNYTFSGSAGAGKTMLAVSILNYINAQNINLKCLFVSMSMLMDLETASFSGADGGDARKLEMCIKNCDVLVLDDLGSESTLQVQEGNRSIPQSKDYVQRALFRICDYRKSKTNIVTTNNTSIEIQRIYNPKIYSRLISKKKENIIVFNSQDMRNI